MVQCDKGFIAAAREACSMIALFILGLAAVAIGPALALLTDRAESAPSVTGTTSAGMFVAINDNAQASYRLAA
jgi:hypothetical protein